MKFGFSTNLFINYSLEESLNLIAKSGFKYVEILADAPHAELLNKQPSGYEHIRLLLNSLSLSVCNVNANTVRCMNSTPGDFQAFRPSLHEMNPNQRRSRVEYTRRAIELAAYLNSPVCTVASGPKVNESGISTTLLNHTLCELIDFADELGVKLALEYEPGLLIGNYAQTKKLLRNHDLLTLNFDVGHAVVAGEDPIEIINDGAPRISNIHFEDIKNQVHYHLPPGEGDLDLEAIIRALQENEYNGVVTFELYSCVDRPKIALEKAAQFAAKYGK